jgi:hypothetical protein
MFALPQYRRQIIRRFDRIELLDRRTRRRA